MLWGIAIADTRISGHERATVEISRTELTCRVDGRDMVMNDDAGEIRAGLFRRYPWFGTNAYESMQVKHSSEHRSVILEVGRRPDRAWHFWAASRRKTIPAGRFEGCTVRVRARVSPGALLQVGFDYWRDSNVEYGSGGNSHEAGASDWYLPSDEWQTAEFTDMPGPN